MIHDRLHISPAVRASVSCDGLVLLDIEGGMLLAANPIGARIWELLEQDRTPDEIAGQLVADYAISYARAESDLTAFLAELAARGLVIEAPTC